MGKRLLRAIIGSIEKTSEWTGKGVSWIMVILVLEVSYDVTLRYAFNEPTLWSYDISYMLAGTVIMMAAAWVLLMDGHISLDVISNREFNRFFNDQWEEMALRELKEKRDNKEKWEPDPKLQECMLKFVDRILENCHKQLDELEATKQSLRKSWKAEVK